jgi:Haem-binding uptake, Tiki superfamily, ChaN
MIGMKSASKEVSSSLTPGETVEQERTRRRVAGLESMGSVSAIRARRRTAAQQLALQQVKRDINATDPHGRLKYLRDFTEAYLDYTRVLTPPELQQQFRAGDVLLLGDYHALAASQDFAAGLLETLAGDGRPVILAMEMVFARDQRVLDRWYRGEISEDELRCAIRYDAEWGYDWEPFARLLRRARRHAAGVYGIDAGSRGSMRRIGVRDRHAAIKIAELRGKFPQSRVVALFGEAHLAPNHLPRSLRQYRPQDRILTVLQNVDELYWKSAGEFCDSVPAVQVADEVFCVFNATPLEKYESYRIYIERWRTDPSQPDLAPTFYNVVDSLLRSLGLEQSYPAAGHHPSTLVEEYPEVQTCSGVRECERLLTRRRSTDAECRQAQEKLRLNGCVYLPRHNLLLMERFQMAAAAEEAVRFVQGECRGPASFHGPWVGSSAEHQFYFEVMERALITFGVRVLLPHYPVMREGDLQALCSQPKEVIEEQMCFSHRQFIDLASFLILHKEAEKKRRWNTLPQAMTWAFASTGKSREFLVQHLGSMLGAEMHEAYLAGALTRSYLRSLFFRKTHLPGAAKKAYFELARRVKSPQQTRFS